MLEIEFSQDAQRALNRVPKVVGQVENEARKFVVEMAQQPGVDTIDIIEPEKFGDIPKLVVYIEPNQPARKRVVSHGIEYIGKILQDRNAIPLSMRDPNVFGVPSSFRVAYSYIPPFDSRKIQEASETKTIKLWKRNTS